MVPGRTAILLVPSIAYDEAKEALAAFDNPEPEVMTELTSDLRANRRKRKGVAAVILIILFAPLALAILAYVVMLVGTLFK